MTALELAAGIDPSLLALAEAVSESTPISTTVGLAFTVLGAAGIALFGAGGLWSLTRKGIADQKTAISELAEAQAKMIVDRDKALAGLRSQIDELETKLETYREERRQWGQKHFQPIRDKVLMLERDLEHIGDRPRSHPG